MSTEVIPHVVYHVAGMGNYVEVVSEQLRLLKDSGLDDLRITHVGEGIDWLKQELARVGLNAVFISESLGLDHFETLAMLEIERLAKVEKTIRPILYLHTKGVSNPADTAKVKWRRVMEEAVVRDWRNNLKYLENHHVVGWNWLALSDKPHFPGTFWIASPHYIRVLPSFVRYHWDVHGGSRYSCEMWIGQGQGGCLAKSVLSHNETVIWHRPHEILDRDLLRIQSMRNQVYGVCDYNGIRMQQRQEVTTVWPRVLEVFNPSRVLEIGTGYGGFAALIKDALVGMGKPDVPVWSIDPHVREGQELARQKGVVIDNIEPFGPRGLRVLPKIIEFIQQPGRTVVLCDGGDKAREFNLLTPVLKVGDLICAHDYADNDEIFRSNYLGKVWNWHEIQDSDIRESIDKFGLVPFQKQELNGVMWCGFIKGKSVPCSKPKHPEITVVIPTIPARHWMLMRALESVDIQTLSNVEIVVEYDLTKSGSAATRNRGLEKVKTEWVAFLDDDDEFLPHHLETLVNAAKQHNADVVYSLPVVIDRHGNKIQRLHVWGGGPEFDPEFLRKTAHIQTTSLVRSQVAKKVGGFKFIQDTHGAVNDDHGFYLSLLNAGAKFYHVHEETFVWYHHGCNTSGQPDRT